MNEIINVNFSKIEKHVVCKGENFDSNRNIEITVNDTEVMICLDESHRVLQVLEADGNIIGSGNKSLAERCVRRLVADSKITIYTAREERDYIFYKEEIRPNSECPEIDDNMLIFSTSDKEDYKIKDCDLIDN